MDPEFVTPDSFANLSDVTVSRSGGRIAQQADKTSHVRSRGSQRDAIRAALMAAVAGAIAAVIVTIVLIHVVQISVP
jgi:hypothetical protein